jgi:4-hydroxybutyryl-CoA dehydratase/vinylacetyl-CoA-Delta-isomerase
MPMMTGRQYIESLQRMKPVAYLFGERIERPVEHPFIKPSQNAIALTYDLAHDPEYAHLLTAHSSLIDGPVNRFTHIYQRPDDLVKKVNMARLMGQKTATCFQRCTTMDTANALHIATFETDRELGTHYHQRFLDFLREVQEKDLDVGVAMTDVKGDRSLRPSEQADPDLYLRIVREKSDGIVVRGAKANQTGSLNCHYTFVAPTCAMREEDRDYAVAFAVPSDEKGIIHVYGRQFSDSRKLEGCTIDVGNPRYGAQETLMVFDDVFVPWERVFLCREYQFAGRISYLFGSNHRQTYGGCKAGVSDVLIGAVTQLAEYNGAAQFAHVRDKILEMVTLTETVYSCGIAAAVEGQQMSSGIYFTNLLLGNVCKLNVASLPYRMAQLAVDIAGGIVGTLPSEKEFRHPQIGKYLEKYLRGVEGMPTEHRVRIVRLIENLIFGPGAVGYMVESMQGAAPPAAQKSMLARLVDFDHKKSLARSIAGIE